MMIIVPLPRSIGGLFVIGRDEWIAVNDRVSAIIEAAPLRDALKYYLLASFDALLSVSERWRQSTYAELVGEAALAGVFARDAAHTLTQLQSEIAGLKPTDPVPERAAFTIKVGFASLADGATERLVKAAALEPLIADFVAQNRAADATIVGIGRSLGDQWRSLDGPLGDIEKGMIDLDRGWGNVVDVLKAAGLRAQDITMAELLAADIALAIQAWNELAQVAAGFDRRAASRSAVSGPPL
ncbi:MAG TPA: hypothetical protein VK446_15100 [Methylocystis sp.]|nr:hypothetical protein [Methylocystis sp.]